MKRQKRQWIVGIVMGSPDGPSFGSVTVEAEGYMIEENNDLCFRNDIKDRCDTVAVSRAQAWLWLGWLGSVVKGVSLAHARERQQVETGKETVRIAPDSTMENLTPDRFFLDKTIIVITELLLIRASNARLPLAYKGVWPMFKGDFRAFLSGLLVGFAVLLIGAAAPVANRVRPLLSQLPAPPDEWVNAYGTESSERLLLVYHIAELRNRVQRQEVELANLKVKLQPAQPVPIPAPAPKSTEGTPTGKEKQ